MKVDPGRKVMVAVSGFLVAFTLLGGVLGHSLAVEGTYSYLKLFNEVLFLIRNNYVEPVKEETLMEGAYRGMLEDLDPQSEYLTAPEFRRASRGERNGPADVGLVLSKRRGYAVVVSALEGSPAARAGLLTGDQILTIDQRSTRSMGAWEASQALQGRAGTEVRLAVIRSDDSQKNELRLLRKLPLRTPVAQNLLEPGVGLLRLGGLQTGDAERVRKSLQTLRSQGAIRLLLDLRSNGGSNLEEAVKMAGLFTGEGKVVTVSNRVTGIRELQAPAGGPAWAGAVVVLVNGGTANAAEVLAAAIRDRAGASLVGEKTWGIGAVQEVIALPAGDGIRISVGKYLSPNGTEWNGAGLKPDVEEIASRPSTGPDLQVQKGLEVLKGGAGTRRAA